MNTDSPRQTTETIRTLLRRLPTNVRGHVVAVLGEFVGTISFLFFAFAGKMLYHWASHWVILTIAGTQVANISSNTNTGTMVVTKVVQKNPAQLLYISLAFGFSLAVNAWVFFRISGGLFNPAVSDMVLEKCSSRGFVMECLCHG